MHNQWRASDLGAYLCGRMSTAAGAGGAAGAASG